MVALRLWTHRSLFSVDRRCRLQQQSVYSEEPRDLAGVARARKSLIVVSKRQLERAAIDAAYRRRRRDYSARQRNNPVSKTRPVRSRSQGS